MICVQCQHENEADAAFCEECGAKLELLCPGCGQPVKPGAKFCKKCGSPPKFVIFRKVAIEFLSQEL